MTITPDTKDWTWVVEARCAECGVDAATLDVARTGAIIRAMTPAWAEALRRPDVAVQPNPSTWSPLEYACHVRDVYDLYDHRLQRMLTEDGPHYANWDQDVTAVEDRYGEQDPAAVAGELAASGERLAARFDTVSGDQWRRTGFRSDGAAFTIESFARYLLHDPLHHLWDVDAPLPAL